MMVKRAVWVYISIISCDFLLSSGSVGQSTELKGKDPVLVTEEDWIVGVVAVAVPCSNCTRSRGAIDIEGVVNPGTESESEWSTQARASKPTLLMGGIGRVHKSNWEKEIDIEWEKHSSLIYSKLNSSTAGNGTVV